MVKAIEDIYEDVLAGRRKRFPRETWKKDSYGYGNFDRCLRHVVNKLNLSREEIVDIDHEFFRKYRLRGGLVMLYGQNIKPAVINAFPEHDLKEWEFFRTTKDEEFAITALQEIVKKKGWSRDNFLEGRSNLYKDTDIRRITNWLTKNNIPVASFIKKALPDFNFSDEELRQHLSRERMKDEIKDTFENKLGWSKEDIINKMTREVANEHFYQAYHTFRNILEMVQSVYPDIVVLKSVVMPFTEEAKDRIIQDVRAGHKTKDIIDRYGISRTTLTNIKRENGLTRWKRANHKK